MACLLTLAGCRQGNSNVASATGQTEGKVEGTAAGHTEGKVEGSATGQTEGKSAGYTEGKVEETVAEKAAWMKAEMKAKLRRERVTEPITVKALRVEFSENVAANTLVGTVEPAKNSVVTTLHQGTLKKILVRKGQTIEAGTVIAEVDAQSVNSAYDAAKAVYDQAADALWRVKKVYASGSVTEAKLMEVRTAYAKAKAALQSAQKAKNDCQVKAPYAGVVSEIYPHEGMEIAALAPLIQLSDISSVEVHAAVPENEYASYDVGMRVKIDVPAADKSLNGILAVKGVEANKISRSYDCSFKFDDTLQTSGIMPGMVCKVHLTGACQNAIVIPASAVMVDADGRYVWCCNDGTVVKKHIEAGGFSGKGIIVTQGLEPGDMLVVEGSRKISDGMSGIRVIE